MHRWRRWVRLWVASVSTLAMALTASPAVGAVPQGLKPRASQVVSLRDTRPTRVSPQAQAAVRKGGNVSFLVMLRDQADASAAATRGKEASRRKGVVSSDAIALAGRQAVVEALRETAGRSQADLARALDNLAAKGHVSKSRPLWVVNGFAVTGNKAALEALTRHPSVSRIDLDETVYLLTDTPMEANDSAPGLASIEWGIDLVGAPGAWALGIDGTGTVVASIDTGVEWNHPALQTRFRGYDPANPGSPSVAGNWFDAVNGAASPYDDDGHGTHVTGTMVGQDGANVIGVAPGARWIAAKAFAAGGTGSASALLAAGQYLLAPTDAGGNPRPEWAPDVINNSWGGGSGLDEWFRPMVQSWRAAGIFPAFASGNSGPGNGSVSSPGNYPESFAVGATDQHDMLAGFSSRGPSPYGEIKPEVSAPGVGVRSSVPGGGYAAFSGTSMATPHVSGAIAVLRSADAGLTVDQLEAVLMSTAVVRTDAQYPGSPNNGYGHGRLDVFGAVMQAVMGSGTLQGRVASPGDDLEPPTVAHTPTGAAFAGIPLTVSAAVSDNIGVLRADLYARANGDPFYTRIPMNLQSGDHRNGTWQATIPGGMVHMAGLQYYLEAMDGSGNSAANGSAAAPHMVAISRGVTPGYFHDFESNPDTWTHGGVNDPWEWGIPTSGPGAAFSGERVLATNLSGDYGDGANAWLLMPPIDLTETPQGAVLQLMHWYNLETDYDFGRLYTSTDGENWTEVAALTGASDGWQQLEVDLRPHAGQVVYAVFQLVSDGSVTAPGWYLDDVRVVGPDEESPDAPTNMTAVPETMGGVVLTWELPTAPDLANIRVHRSSASGGPYTAIATLGKDASSYTDASPPAGQTSYYVATATDLWGNESDLSNEASATPAGADTVFFDDMEAGPGGWTTGGTNNDWQHGAPAAGPGNAHSGTKVWATNLSGPYRNNSNSWLMTPAIDLTTYTSATLRFAHWYQIESNWDFGRVEVSTDGGASWTQLAAYTSSSPVAWAEPVISLDSVTGSIIHLRFRLETDGSVTYSGWHIDDVRVVAAPAAPAIAVSPARVLAKPKPSLPAPGIRIADLKQGKVKETSSPAAGIASLPMDATVTVAETGRTVRTNPADGRYSMRHAAGTWTAVAEAYGFYSSSHQVEIARDGTVVLNFMMQPIPTGTVSGVVTDRRTGEPLSGAQVRVLEDTRVAPAYTAADGGFQLTVLEGTYTLQITLDGYYPQTEEVTVPGGGNTDISITLRQFVGMDGELVYDDGSPENAWAFFTGGDGWAVRFSLPDGTEAARLTGARFRFWDTSWPDPGGTDFKVSIYSADGPGGAPGSRLAGPMPATARRDGSWTDVDLSAAGLMVNGDFYIAYIQAADYPNVPGLATDESGPPYDRSWTLVGGSWSQSPPDEGNRMIRALVQTEVPSPVITSPVDGTHTNNANLIVTGRAAKGVTVTVLRNGTEQASTVADGGEFTVTVALVEGENELTAVATANGDVTDPSEPVRVYLDLSSPELTVSAPTDGLKWNRGDITVSGRASDNLGHVSVLVNGTSAPVAGDGTFSLRMLVNEGENEIVITAADRAGNTVTERRTVHVKTTAPVITAMEPATDVTLNAGDTMTIRFESEPGLEATYAIVLTGQQVTQLPGTAMTEVSPGVYEGTYTAPANTSFQSAAVVLQARDAYGNQSQATAPGRVSISSNQPPRAVILGPTQIRRNQMSSWSGSGSSDPDGSITRYEWDMGDGTRYTTRFVLHRYRATGTFTITLTVTDDKGSTGTATRSVTVTGP